MNFSSKSILSPGHSDKSREPTLSFSSSLSRRRLRSNGSISSSSPMFPTGSKKRGCAFETPEPSSPKVTCIGQVRVNTKKKKKKQQQGNKNNRNGDVVSFRKATTDNHSNHQEEGIDCLPHRNPKWVHLPFTICEALRSFGADFNCFQPCGGRSCSSASTSERDNKEEKRATIPSGRTTATTSSCGAIFLRWLMALQEGERVEEKRRRMEIGEEEEEVERERIKLVDEMEIEEEEEEEELEEARVSICIPPKNALLLMRCRSDPMRMSSLANRFWDSPVAKEVEEEADDDDDDEYYDQESEGDDEVEVEGRNEQKEEDVVVEEMDPELEEKHNLDKTQEKLDSEEDTLEEEEEQEQVNSLEGDNNLEEQEVVVMVNGFSTEALESQRLEEPKLLKTVTDDANEEKMELGNGEALNSEEPKLEERVMDAEKDEEEEVVSGSSSSPEGLEIPSLDENPNPKLQEREEEEEEEEEMDERKEGSSSSSSEVEELIELLEEEKPTLAEEVAFLYLDERIEKSIEEEEEEKKVTVEIEEEEEEKKVTVEAEEEIHEHGNEEKERIVHQLPDCLLLMLYEPKLSMEVSKETWVCSTDFIRKKHRREVMLINGGDLCKKRIDFNSDFNNPTAEVVVAHPPPSMASLIEQKLVNAVAYEPLVLTRCKSEPPLRSFSAKLGF